MILTSIQLRERAAKALDEVKAISQKATAEGRELTDEELNKQVELSKAAQADYEKANKLDSVAKVVQTLNAPVKLPLAQEPLAGDARNPADPGYVAPAAVPAVAVDHEAVARCQFQDAGEFYLSVWRATQGSPDYAFDQRLALADPGLRIMGAAGDGMIIGTGAEGGFLVPPAFTTAVWDEMRDDPANLLALTDQFTVVGESLTMVANAETSRATGLRYGGVRGYYRSEAEQMTESRPRVRQLRLEPHELYVFVPVSERLLRSAGPAVTQYVTRAAVQEINFLVSDALINGNGTGKPLGLLSSTGIVSVAKETGQGADTVEYANVNNMWSRCHSRARPGAVWFINQDIEPQLNLMAFDPAATSKIPVYLPANMALGAQSASLFGRPVIAIEHCATLGDKGDIILANFAFYASGTRGGIDAAISMHLRFDFAESVFRWQFMVDGQPWLASPLTPFKGTNTLSPFVTLDERT